MDKIVIIKSSNICLFICLFYQFILITSNNIKESDILKVNNRYLSNRINPFIFYIADGEGLISQARRADLIWNIANAVHRVVYAVDFKSGHFFSKPVSLCNVFDMPKNFTCVSNKTQEQVFQEYHCVCPLAPGAGSVSHFKGYPKDIDTERYFDYLTVECVAGGFRTGDGIYPKYTRFPIVLTGKIFNEYYSKYLSKLKKLLEISKNGYHVAHWRRDDGKKACQDMWKIKNAVNCGSPEEFIKTVNNISMYYNKDPSLVKFISTDEGNKTILQYLADNGLKLFTTHLAKGMDFLMSKSLNTKLDMFVFELMLQADANYYYAWGRSSVHHFICEIRVYTNPKKITVIDEKQITQYLDCKGALR